MSKNNIKYLFALLTTLVVFNSCKKEYESIDSIDDGKIQAYLKQNNVPAIKDPSGYYYQVLEQGAGSTIKNPDSIYYSYTFKNLAGKVILQTSDLSIQANYLGYSDRFVIGGTSYLLTPVREVLTLLNRGGKASLILPSKMAFGKNGVSKLEVASNEIITIDLGIYNLTKRYEVEDFEINSFIAKNNLNLTKLNTAYFSIVNPGTGTEAISLSSTIKANYTLRSLDGTVIEKSTDGAFSAMLSTLFKGWQQILPGRVTKGGRIRIVIPSALAGVNVTQPLDFDIEIVDVTN